MLADDVIIIRIFFSGKTATNLILKKPVLNYDNFLNYTDYNIKLTNISLTNRQNINQYLKLIFDHILFLCN